MSESVYPTATQTYDSESTSYPTSGESDKCSCNCSEYIDNKKPPPPPPHPPPPPPPPHHHKDDIPSYDQKYFILESNNGTCLNVSMAIIFTIVYDMLENSVSCFRLFTIFATRTHMQSLVRQNSKQLEGT